MPGVLAYHRPRSLDEASRLLLAPNRKVLGGGTAAVPAARQTHGAGLEFVDLQSLGLDSIGFSGESISLGAMVRLSEIVDDSRLPVFFRDLAKRELPSALRDQATIGGTVVFGSSTSVLVAGLLAYGCNVILHTHGAKQLESVLVGGVSDDIVTSITVDVSGMGAIAATGRTPADEPIVAAVGVNSVEGIRLALTGVAPVPILVDPDDPAGGLEPAGDFRGSRAYRVHLAEILAKRVLKEVS